MSHAIYMDHACLYCIFRRMQCVGALCVVGPNNCQSENIFFARTEVDGKSQSRRDACCTGVLNKQS